MSAHRTARSTVLAPLLPLVAALAVWAPLRHNFFWNDDFVHLYDIATRSLWGFSSELFLGQLYLVRNLVFAGLFHAFGPDPRPFFWSVLLTHVINVLLLERAIRGFTDDRVLACVGAVLWGTCPVLEGALGWYSAYGQVLLTTLVLVVVSDLAGRETLRPRRALCWGGLLAVGATCYTAGLAVCALFPLTVLLVLPDGRRRPRGVGILAATAVAVFALYLVLHARSSDADIAFREALSARATVAALPAAAALAGHLLAFGAYALLLGFLGRAPLYPAPISLAVAAIVAAVIGLGWLRGEAVTRRRLVGIGLLLVAVVAMTAVGRASVFVFYREPVLTAALAPRYQYLPLAFLALMLCLALASLRSGSRAAARTVYAAALGWVLARTVVLLLRPLPIDHHDWERAETERVLRTVREAATSAPPGATVRIENQLFLPSQFILHFLPGRLPGWAGIFVVFSPDDRVEGRRVRFVVSDDDWQRIQQRGGRIAALVERRAQPDSPQSNP